MFKEIELQEREEFRLESIEIGITSKCNLSCEYCCAYGKDENTFLDAEQVISLIKELSSLKRVKLSGGEVLLYYDECLRIIEFCSSRGIYTQINSNGTLLNPIKIKCLKEKGLGTLHLSVNFDNCAEYREYYNQPEKSFYVLEKVIRASIQLGINVVVETIVFIHTIKRIKDLLRYISALGVTQVEIQTGISVKKSEWTSSVKSAEICQLIKDIYNEKPAEMSIYFSCLPDSVLKKINKKHYGQSKIYFPSCIDGKNQLHLHSNGDVLICELGYPQVLGNIFEGLDLKSVMIDSYVELKDFATSHKCAKFKTYK